MSKESLSEFLINGFKDVFVQTIIREISSTYLDNISSFTNPLIDNDFKSQTVFIIQDVTQSLYSNATQRYDFKDEKYKIVLEEMIKQTEKLVGDALINIQKSVKEFDDPTVFLKAFSSQMLQEDPSLAANPTKLLKNFDELPHNSKELRIENIMQKIIDQLDPDVKTLQKITFATKKYIDSPAYTNFENTIDNEITLTNYRTPNAGPESSLNLSGIVRACADTGINNNNNAKLLTTTNPINQLTTDYEDASSPILIPGDKKIAEKITHAITQQPSGLSALIVDNGNGHYSLLAIDTHTEQYRYIDSKGKKIPKELQTQLDTLPHGYKDITKQYAVIQQASNTNIDSGDWVVKNFSTIATYGITAELMHDNDITINNHLIKSFSGTIDNVITNLKTATQDLPALDPQTLSNHRLSTNITPTNNPIEIAPSSKSTSTQEELI